MDWFVEFEKYLKFAPKPFWKWTGPWKRRDTSALNLHAPGYGLLLLTTFTSILLSFDLRKSEVEERKKKGREVGVITTYF